MKAHILWFGAALGTLLVLVGWLLLGSEPGLRLLRQAVDGRGGIVIGAAKGKLLGRFSLEKVGVDLSGVRLSVDRMLWEWKPMELLRGNLHLAELDLRGVTVRFVEAGEEIASPHSLPPSAQAMATLPDTLLPLPLLLDRVTIEGLRLEDEEGDELLVVDTFLMRLQGGVDGLRLDTLTLQGPEIGLSVHGTIDFSRKWQVDLLGTWNLVNYGFNRLTGTLSASGPIDAPRATLAINTPVDIRVEGQVVNLLHSPAWTATLQGTNVDLEMFIQDCPQIVVKTIHGQLSGNVDGYGGLVRADVDWGLADNLHLETDISGGLLGIDFDTLSLTRGRAKLTAENAKIDWKRLFDWQGRFLVEGFDPTMFFPWLPGSIDGEIDNIGTVRDDLGVDASFAVRQLQGTLHNRPVAAQGDLVLTENDISSRGIILHSGEVEGSAEILAGKLSWAETLDWQLSLRLTDFDPSGLFATFPGRISGLFQGQGVLGEGDGEGFLKISDLSGTLRGNALSGGGEIFLVGESLSTSGLYLQSGLSKLVVEGHAGEVFALDFTFDSPDISTLLPESGGTMHLRGRLRGSLAAPLVELDLTGEGLTHGDTTVAKLAASLSSRFGGEERLAGFVEMEGFAGGVDLDRGRLDFAGTLAVQQLDLSVSGVFGTLRGQGEVARSEGWHGRITGLQLESDLYGPWRQERSAELVYQEGELRLDTFCGSAGEARFCLGGTLRGADHSEWRIDGRLAGFPLDLLNRWQWLTLPVSGNLSAEFHAAGAGDHLLGLQGYLKVPELHVDIGLEDEDINTVVFEDTGLTVDLVDQRLHGDLAVMMRNGSRLTLAATLDGPEISPNTLLSLPLSGELRVAGLNLAIVSALTDYGVDPVGRASGDFTLGGTLGRPQLVGEGRIDQGGINLPFQGITLEGLKVKIEAVDEGVHLSGRMVSGPGEVRADGILRYGEQGVEGSLRLEGYDFLLVNLPEWAIRVDPAVDLTFSRKSAELKGVVRIPYAQLTPEEMKDSVQESPDVVLVHGREEMAGGGWPFSLDLDIVLGEVVRIDGYGLSGRLGGRLQVKAAAGDPPTALGELDLIDGTYSIYGRTLDIARGRILFTGGPIDNPGVDVRAQRTFSDEVAKSRGYTVGVDISGLAQDLKFQLFSDPYMDNTEILSQLIVGHSLAFSTAEESGLLVEAAATLGLTGGNDLFQGIGSILQLDDMHLEGSSKKEDVSLVVGKRLTDDLYIGYDVNMFSQLGRFRVRYDLIKGFAVETSSSSQSTGADLLYSFEK